MRRLILALVLLVCASPCLAGGPQLLFLAALKGGALPAQVTGVSASSSPAQITVSWTAVSGATSYNFYYSTTDNSAGATKISGVAGNSYAKFNGLSQGTTYYVWVSANNASGEGPLSASAFATAGAPSYASTFYMAASQPSRTSPDGRDGWVIGDDPVAVLMYDTGGPVANAGYARIFGAADSMESESSGSVQKTVTAAGTVRLWARGTHTPGLLANDYTMGLGTMSGPPISQTVWQEYTFNLSASVYNIAVTTASSYDSNWTDVSLIDLPR